MISEGSCDTEDWSNDAGNSALIIGIDYILKYIKAAVRNFFWGLKMIQNQYLRKYITQPVFKTIALL